MVSTINSNQKTSLPFPHQTGFILSLVKMPAHTISSSKKTSSTLFHYSPLPTATTTLFEHLPLSSTTTITHTFYRTTTLADFTTPLVGLETPTSTTRLDLSLTSNTPTSSSTGTWAPKHTVVPNSEKQTSSAGLAIVVLIFFAILAGMTMTIWWMEPHARDDTRDSISQKITKSSQTGVLEPFGGLDIMIQSEGKGTKRNIGYRERLRAWLVNSVRKTSVAATTERWSDSVVTARTAELGMDAEKGLLLPVRENERFEAKRHQIDFDILAETLAA